MTASLTDETRNALVEQGRQQLEATLHDRHPHVDAGSLEAVHHGTRSVVYRADSHRDGTVAIKVPYKDAPVNADGTVLYSNTLLRQEEDIARAGPRIGVPCPEPLAFYSGPPGEDFSFLTSRYIEVDGTQASHEAIGALTRSIHTAGKVRIDTSVMNGQWDADVVVARRLEGRLSRLRTRAGGVPIIDVADVFAELGPCIELPVLLHMDIRYANLFVQDYTIVAVIDWANAMFGPPALELAHLAEHGYLTSPFLAAYGNPDRFGAVSPQRESLYRLDAAVALIHGMLDEGADATVLEHRMGRVCYLAEALQRVERPGNKFRYLRYTGA